MVVDPSQVVRHGFRLNQELRMSPNLSKTELELGCLKACRGTLRTFPAAEMALGPRNFLMRKSCCGRNSPGTSRCAYVHLKRLLNAQPSGTGFLKSDVKLRPRLPRPLPAIASTARANTLRLIRSFGKCTASEAWLKAIWTTSPENGRAL